MIDAADAIYPRHPRATAKPLRGDDGELYGAYSNAYRLD
jgi:hypothetical protein